jgi:hypothetical protein
LGSHGVAARRVEKAKGRNFGRVNVRSSMRDHHPRSVLGRRCPQLWQRKDERATAPQYKRCPGGKLTTLFFFFFFFPKQLFRVTLLFVLQPGELIALMGGSGAGKVFYCPLVSSLPFSSSPPKSTLLNCLADRLDAGLVISGAMLVNGLNMSDDFKRSSVYVFFWASVVA